MRLFKDSLESGLAFLYTLNHLVLENGVCRY
jgi:hypothetical protein